MGRCCTAVAHRSPRIARAGRPWVAWRWGRQPRTSQRAGCSHPPGSPAWSSSRVISLKRATRPHSDATMTGPLASNDRVSYVLGTGAHAAGDAQSFDSRRASAGRPESSTAGPPRVRQCRQWSRCRLPRSDSFAMAARDGACAFAALGSLGRHPSDHPRTGGRVCGHRRLHHAARPVPEPRHRQPPDRGRQSWVGGDSPPDHGAALARGGPDRRRGRRPDRTPENVGGTPRRPRC
ncbi:MAG: hypothetical protein AVDCRST_MAG10-948 [uncultured Acidimicrobiales bacterium]|uniref:Uncharacterized protein n=1 Tax=uncultured Acidimicrobiales bacterium TaxID=310071 RepID=A0A6J4HKN6_9ACTN|nr:MAG: hypothetical protein AVDCRST_MAG10-948 [uncultured Acidimicrobiales bacterium]